MKYWCLYFLVCFPQNLIYKCIIQEKKQQLLRNSLEKSLVYEVHLHKYPAEGEEGIPGSSFLIYFCTKDMKIVKLLLACQYIYICISSFLLFTLYFYIVTTWSKIRNFEMLTSFPFSSAFNTKQCCCSLSLPSSTSTHSSRPVHPPAQGGSARDPQVILFQVIADRAFLNRKLLFVNKNVLNSVLQSISTSFSQQAHGT